MGIPGNECVDLAAKNSNNLIETTMYTHLDLSQYLKKNTINRWNQFWRNTTSPLNKLREIKELPIKWEISNRSIRKEEIYITRILIGHSRLTHKHLLDKTDPPICNKCNSNIVLTIKHIVTECTSLHTIRNQLGIPNNMKEALTDDSTKMNQILELFKQTGFLNQL